MTEFVAVRFKDTGGVGSVPVDALPYWEERGYEQVAADADGNPLSFDPADHSVKEVVAYLADADPVEYHRVIAAEQATDDPRKGVLGAPAPETDAGIPVGDGATVGDTEENPAGPVA